MSKQLTNRSGAHNLFSSGRVHVLKTNNFCLANSCCVRQQLQLSGQLLWMSWKYRYSYIVQNIFNLLYTCSLFETPEPNLKTVVHDFYIFTFFGVVCCVPFSMRYSLCVFCWICILIHVRRTIAVFQDKMMSEGNNTMRVCSLALFLLSPFNTDDNGKKNNVHRGDES